MKRKIKIILSCLLSVILLAISVCAVDAVSYVVDTDGSKYLINTDGTIEFAGYQGTYSKVYIPAEFDNKPVISVTDFAMYQNDVVDYLSFEYAYNLQSIGDYAFMGCNNITSVYLTDSNITVNVGAFRECSSLVYSVFLANNNKIPAELFYSCSLLKDVKLSDKLTEIGSYAFGNCTSLEYIELPSSVTYIGNGAFENDENLILGVYYDSYAHQYAVENRIAHKILDRQPGDVNSDGVVDILDSTEIQKFAAEKVEFTEEQFELGDINNDGYVDVMDALLVQKYVVGKYDIPPIIYNS